MEISKINELANDVAVARELIKYKESVVETLIRQNQELQDLYAEIEDLKSTKARKQSELLSAMESQQLKSWKTEEASFSRVQKQTVKPNPSYAKQIEERVKGGEAIEGWELSETQYLSIRSNKK